MTIVLGIVNVTTWRDVGLDRCFAIDGVSKLNLTA